MAEAELHCNFRKCHKILEYVGFMTSCSHAFCAEHGRKILTGNSSNLKCPVCDSMLIDGQDIIRTNLNPTDKFKSMALVGLRPDDTLEIALRSLRFWNFQITQELSRTKLAAEHYKTKLESLTSDLLNTERVKKQHDNQIKQMQSVIQQDKIELLAKNRLIQKLQIDLDNERTQKRMLQNQHQTMYDSPAINSKPPQKTRTAEYQPRFETVFPESEYHTSAERGLHNFGIPLAKQMSPKHPPKSKHYETENYPNYLF